VEGGEVRQYLVWPDGTTTLVGSRPLSLLYRRLDAIRPVIGWLAIAAVVWLIVSQATHFHEETLGFAAGLVRLSHRAVCLRGRHESRDRATR
jgi:hypothetical protein